MNDFKHYYLDELAFLRELGREFAHAHPAAAPFLAEPGADPDVERLLEGVAFLSGRIRQKLDDELPEVTHALIDAVFPHYTRPLPAMTMVQFQPAATQRETVHVAAQAALDALPRDGTACRFHSVWPVAVSPVRLENMRAHAGPPRCLHVDLRLPAGASFASLGLTRLRFYLGDDHAAARLLYLCLLRHRGIHVECDGQRLAHATLAVAPVGFADDEPLLPQAGSAGSAQRLLHEWFAFPQKFQAVDLLGLDTLCLAINGNPTLIRVVVTCAADYHLPPLTPSSLLLHCTPAVNVFAARGEPLTLDQAHSEHRLRPVGIDPRHVEIFAVTRVEGRSRGQAEVLTFQHRLIEGASRGGQGHGGRWHERRRPAVLDDGVDVDLLLSGTPQTNAAMVVSTALLCTNRNLPMHLGIGDLRLATEHLPAGITFRNLTIPTAAVRPLLAGDLHWRFLAHLTLDYGSALTVAGLRGLLQLYDVRALSDHSARVAHQRLAEAIVAVRAVPTTRYLEGIPIRGIAVTIDVDDEHLGGVGEAHMLGTILDGFVASFVSLNAFTRLQVFCQHNGQLLSWADRLGRRHLL